MGQYHKIVNMDKKQFLQPHKFDDGLKLMEFGCSSDGTMTALAVLLACACKGGARGGGDIHSADPLVGSWAGDRIAIVGDYMRPEDLPGSETGTYDDGTPMPLYGLLGDDDAYTDISKQILRVLHEAGEGR